MPSDSIGFPACCRAAVFTAPGQPLELQEFPIPRPEAGEAIVRVKCCTLCGSDLHTMGGARREATPSILGHEILGEVVAIGEPAPRDLTGRALEPGDRVTWSTAVACGDCDRCRAELPQKCRSLTKYGHELAVGRAALCGGLAEFLLLRRGSAVVRATSELPDEVACPANCATATVAAALRAAGQVRGRRVLVFGAGMLGLTAAAMAKQRGAACVVVCDHDEVRLQRAKRFGADGVATWCDEFDTFRARLEEWSGGGFDVLLELAGSTDCVEAAVRLGTVGASIVLVGTVMPSRPAAIDPERVVRNWLTIRGVHNYAPQDLLAAVDFLTAAHRDYPFAELVLGGYTLDTVNEAVRAAREQRPPRVAVRP